MLQLPFDIKKFVSSNDKIYKDDCMYTFDTPENNALGIDIDIITYFAYSRNPDFNYTQQNYEKTGNYLYLNITKTLKPEEERRKIYNENGEKSQKLQKLEIKEIKDEEFYNTKITVYDVKADKSYELEELSAEFKSLVDQILSANSSNRKDEIKQWEQEIIACEHSVDLQQFEVGTVDLSKCTKCELKENLWICLHCGALGCGRQQYGSTLKGNGHALDHYELTAHPVAVKLGSLSDNEESCDVYCYNCNDEVKVPGLSYKLLKFGIDLQSQVKTEKSLIELNIYQNLNWDFKLEGADGEKLPPIYGKGYTGFQNLGNSCYLNSVIQALFDLPNYQNFFKSLSVPDTKNPAEDLTTQLIKIYDGLWSGRYSKPGSLKGDDYQLGLRPSSFKTLIGDNHPEFATQRQQDAFEFLLYFLDKVDNQFGIKLNEPLKYLFSTKTTCANCSHGSIKTELIDNISIPIEDEVLSIDEAGKKIYKEVKFINGFETLCESEGVEGYKCDNCGAEPGLAIKSSGFKTFPEVLIVNAQRIKLENWVPIKIDVPIEIPDELDLSNFTEPKFEGDEVELVEVKKTFIPDDHLFASLSGMGLHVNKCIKGLYHTNNTDITAALNWIFEHTHEPDIDEPLNLEPEGPKPTILNQMSQESIDSLEDMGFSAEMAKKALYVNKNDVNLAIEWLFNNPDDNGIIDTESAINLEEENEQLKERLLASSTDQGKYKLKSVICHKGTSPHTGHYVVFIRKQIDGVDKWVLYNDEKVVVCSKDNLDDIRTNGYVYIFEKV
ncbi:uncharacterized protein RJT21DRAFT_116711 [Scheffersomyces amazonensis]|uniref:uncharacterized protein n=1 Tax=Scheffersomyces amazonensis TaxID=1078765 RepID=UPI00315CCEC5